MQRCAAPVRVASIVLVLGLAMPALAQPRLPGVPIAPRIPPQVQLEGANIAYAALQRGHYQRAFQIAIDLATRGDGAAMALIAELYANGLGVPRDPGRARDWYSNGALRGDPNAMVALADMLMQGVGAPRDPRRAIELYGRAAGLEQRTAKLRLALAAIEGTDMAQDIPRAKLLLTQAADAGDLDAQYALASVLANPDLGTPDPKAAAEWMGKAAMAGYVDAEVEYALMLANGRGVTADAGAAARMMRRAALQGNPVAQNRYARMRANGIGVSVDLVDAARWHMLAKGAGLNDVTLDTMVAGLGEAERKMAETRARKGTLPREIPAMAFGQEPVDTPGMNANGVQRPIIALQAGQDLLRPPPGLIGRP